MTRLEDLISRFGKRRAMIIYRQELARMEANDVRQKKIKSTRTGNSKNKKGAIR